MKKNILKKNVLCFLLFVIGISSLRAQTTGNGSVVWGVQNNPYTVNVDSVGGLHATWSNVGDAGTLNTFSPPRFYHVWVEQLQPSGQWIVPQTNAHFYISDTTWTADATHILTDLTKPIRVRVAPFRVESTVQRTSSPTAIVALVEHPENTRSSDAVSPVSTVNVACCIITVVVDTKPTGTAPPGSIKLGTAVGSPLSIPVFYSTTSSVSLAAYLARPANAGKYVNVETKQTYNYTLTTPITPFLYANAQTATVIAAKSAESANDASLNAQLPPLIQAIYTRLKQNFNGSSTVDDMTIRIIAQ